MVSYIPKQFVDDMGLKVDFPQFNSYAYKFLHLRVVVKQLTLKRAFLRSGSQLMIWGATLEEFVNKVLSFSRKEFGLPGVWTRDLLHVKPVC